MAKQYFDRYATFRRDNEIKQLPFVRIRPKGTDKQVVYKDSKRLDKISQDYYGSPYYGWLILLANPQFGGMEFDIPNETVLRIPFPLMESLQQYQDEVNKYVRLNGVK